MRNRQEWFNEKMAANVPMPYRVFRKKKVTVFQHYFV